MSTSYSITESQAFTVTHATHMAAKVATDLKRMQRLYNQPSDAEIAGYEAECIALLKAGYFGTMTFGFRRNGEWIEPTLKYTARDLAGGTANDDDPGRVRAGANVAGAVFYSYHIYGDGWWKVSQAERDTFPHRRVGAPEPGVNGYLIEDKTYSAGGRALTRSTVRSAT